MDAKTMRKFAITLLDDEQGIKEEAYNILSPYLDEDIKNSSDATEGRVYVGEDFAAEELAKME